jgi:hypothetical protein
MSTFEPAQDEPVAELVPVRPKRRPYIVVVGVVVLVAVTAIVAYAAAAPRTVTKTKTVVVAKQTPTTLAPTCAPGAAPGSCNIDEERAALIPDQPLDTATRAKLAAQLVAARAAALRYPTVSAAVAAGFIPAGKFSPETGAHYINIRATYGGFDPSNPGSYIYDGNSPTSQVVGVMYLGGGAGAPAGFAGPNDHWHRHTNTCVIFSGGKIVVPFAADSSVTPGQCAGVHGTFMPRTTWMVHAWVVPAWESPLGVFSHNNPDLKCADGTEHANAVGFCKGPGDV